MKRKRERRIRGMTGFGRGAAEGDGLRFEVEIKGLNHRFLDVKLRLPPEAGMIEPELRARVKGRIARGRVEISINRTSSLKPAYRVEVREELVAEYLNAARAIKRDFKLRGTVGLDQLLALPGVVVVAPEAGAAESGEEILLQAFEEALNAFDAMRCEEGERLDRDLRTRLREIEEDTRHIKDEARGVPEAHAMRLRERVGQLVGDHRLDEARLAQEVALLADRADITEEVVRLEGYIEQVRAALDKPDGANGKTLDFVMQEMNREATTIMSKAEPLSICQAALRIRAAVDKFREQVQNVE